MDELFTVGKTVEYIVVAVFLAAALYFQSREIFPVMQREAYSGRGFWRWYLWKPNPYRQRTILTGLLGIFACGVISLAFSFLGDYAAVVGLASYVIFFALFYAARRQAAPGVRETPSPRLTGLKATAVFVYAVISYAVVTALNFADVVWGNELFCVLRYCALGLLPMLIAPLAILSNCVSKIYYSPVEAAAKRRARRALEGKRVFVVSGQCGAGTVTRALSVLTEGRGDIDVCPESVLSTYDFERHVRADGDGALIYVLRFRAENERDLCKLLRLCVPSCAAITRVSGDGAQDMRAADVLRCYGKIAAASDALYMDPVSSAFLGAGEGGDVRMDAETAGGRTSVDMNLSGEDVRVTCPAVSEAMAEDFALAACLASEAGVPAADIARRSAGTGRAFAFREYPSGGVTVLDDRACGSLAAFEAGLTALLATKGRKVLVTRGIVESGVHDAAVQERAGKLLCGLDLVILIGKTLVSPMRKAYEAAGGDEEKIRLVKDEREAAGLLSETESGTAVLFSGVAPERLGFPEEIAEAGETGAQ